jgi:hypothetical protein
MIIYRSQGEIGEPASRVKKSQRNLRKPLDKLINP